MIPDEGYEQIVAVLIDEAERQPVPEDEPVSSAGAR